MTKRRTVTNEWNGPIIRIKVGEVSLAIIIESFASVGILISGDGVIICCIKRGVSGAEEWLMEMNVR